LKKIKGWLSKLFKLRLNEIDEDIDRGETWDGITFVKHDGLLNILVSVLICRIVVYELFVEVVEMELDLGTARELPFAARVLVLVVSFRVKLSCDCVFVDGNKISNHVPEEVHLVGGL
jgi:hypothetical protein